jgi:hypothetical protein
MLVKMQTWIDGELKAGKVLSEKNKTIVSDAIAALQALLDATEKGVEPPKSTQQVTEVDEKAANDILEILKEMQNFTKK